MRTLEDLASSVSVGKQTDIILLDFSKAFDKVNHSKLMKKLHQYGICGHKLDWVRAFLGSRSQQVVIDREESESIPVTSGVPLSHTYTSIALDTRLLAQAYQPSQIELYSPGIQTSSRGLIRGLIPGLIFSCPALPSS